MCDRFMFNLYYGFIYYLYILKFSLLLLTDHKKNARNHKTLFLQMTFSLTFLKTKSLLYLCILISNAIGETAIHYQLYILTRIN